MSTEGSQLVRRQWWFGLALAVLGAGVVAQGWGRSGAVSYALGVLAVLLGGVMAGWYSFRRIAPSGSEAAMRFVLGTALRWLVVGVVLVGAFRMPDSEPLWVLIGLVLAQVSSVTAALTFKRR
jgi:F0F1-type ATP synthase assembly protein I